MRAPAARRRALVPTDPRKKLPIRTLCLAMALPLAFSFKRPLAALAWVLRDPVRSRGPRPRSEGALLLRLGGWPTLTIAGPRTSPGRSVSSRCFLVSPAGRQVTQFSVFTHRKGRMLSSLSCESVEQLVLEVEDTELLGNAGNNPSAGATKAKTTTSSTSASRPSRLFDLKAPYEPTGDQPAAIAHLVECLENRRDQYAMLRGSTGTGKTFAVANLITKLNRPALVLCHNKTLASQLCRELRAFFPHNSVELFISYYNHYRPESYKESTGTYMAKKSSVNADIDVLRHCATRSLVTRRDVVVVASVSCIFGIGLPEEYLRAAIQVSKDQSLPGDWVGQSLELSLLYTYHSEGDARSRFDRGMYQMIEHADDNGGPVRVVTLWPSHEPFPMQVHLRSVRADGEETLVVSSIRVGTQTGFREVETCKIFPAKHHVVPEGRLTEACDAIQAELRDRLAELRREGKLEAAARLETRVTQDLETMRETGFCAGGENYSRHLCGRKPGEPPATLLDYFDLIERGDWLLVVDESHVTLPQIKAMYAGDQSRKRMLVKHGYRLPSALDNRPLTADEFWNKVKQTVFVSATPGKQELSLCRSPPAEMIIRPTFVCDPEIHVRPTQGQLQDLLREVQVRATKNQRTLAIALTKRDAEDLSSFLLESGVKATFVHSGLKTKERSDALKALQSGGVDCLVGVNLLREGLDLPQVSLVAVLSACSEGFLRAESSLLQTIGRAARNVDGAAIFYANRVTDSMKRCIDDTSRRRALQLAYNSKHGHEMRSTEGSSTLSIFDILKDRIELEQQQHDLLRLTPSPMDPIDPHTMHRVTVNPVSASPGVNHIETDHLPTSPGVYFWKDERGETLYIGKAANLRSRVKSYLANSADHNLRIQTMIRKARSVEFVITPSGRDALVLESKLIKYHQPRFNVLLKDDEHYPYICASTGDEYPRLFVAPRREDPSTSERGDRYRYFGPYTSFRELNTVMQMIENKYGLRAMSFKSRHGGGSKAEYLLLFEKVLREVFEGNSGGRASDLVNVRAEYESAGLLFDSPHNICRDVVTAVPVAGSKDAVSVQVLQVRDGMVAGRFRYTCAVPCGFSSDADLASCIESVVEHRHYPSASEALSPGGFSWFPQEILVSHQLSEVESIVDSLVEYRKEIEGTRKKLSITVGARRGTKRIADERLLEFALANSGTQSGLMEANGPRTSVEFGLASTDLSQLLSLQRKPRRIECYDISHTQGSFPVGSRVVFIDGIPVPELYRRFNIQSVAGVDDFASLEEVLERRFRRAWVDGIGGPVDIQDPWAMPDLVVIDGGLGQLSAAIKGMSKSQVFPSNETVPTSLDDATLASIHTPATSGKGRRMAVAVCALAKSNEDLYVHGISSPVNDASDSPGLLLLRALRDESHRYALRSHRRRRSILKGV